MDTSWRPSMESATLQRHMSSTTAVYAIQYKAVRPGHGLSHTTRQRLRHRRAFTNGPTPMSFCTNRPNLLKQVVRYLNDRSGVNSGQAAPNVIESLLQVESIDTMLRVFRPLCWPPVNNAFVYLSNEKESHLTPLRPGHLHTERNLLQSWQMQKVQISDDWYLCFVDGRMHAYDTSQSMQQGGQPDLS